jgi:hypothetical protein
MKDRPDIGHALDTKIRFLQHLVRNIGGAETARQPPLQDAVIIQQHLKQESLARLDHGGVG